jgi:Legume lectin domain
MYTGEITNFTTQFSFLIQNFTPSYIGDGLSFFISTYPSQIPVGDADGSCLGLFNCSTSTDPSANQIIAVEFDAYLNLGIDPNSTDPTDCHIGIDVNMIK